MEISEKDWNDLTEQVNGFSAKIEELTTQNAALTAKNEEYESKLAEWQTKLNDQQHTLDMLNKNQNQNENKSGQPKSTHKSVRFDPQKGEYIWDE